MKLDTKISRKIGILAIIIAIGFQALPAFAADINSDLNSKLVSLAAINKLNAAQQTFCVGDGTSIVASANDSVRVIPASVSKLYTFDFALATLGANFRYTTNFTLSGTTLYVNGGGDPHFVIEDLLSVMNQVHTQTGTMITHIVVSPNFDFDWKSSAADVKKELLATLKDSSKAPVSKTFTVTSSTVPYSGPGTTYQFQSAPLLVLIKQISDYSTNISADTLFVRAGGPTAFARYMNATYGVGSDTVGFQTGSGLTNNYTTCGLTLRVMKHLQDTLSASGNSITQIMAVPRIDPGVLEDRLRGLTTTDGIVAKSGSVNYHQNLAGIINTQSGPIYFAVFSTYPKLNAIETAKSFVDAFTQSIAAHYQQVSFNYVPQDILFASTKVTKLFPTS